MNTRFKQSLAGLLAATIVTTCWLAENSFAETLSTMVRLSGVTAQVPTGIAVGREGTLFVIQASANRVAVIDKSGNRRTELSGFQELSSIAVDQTGRLYVGDAGKGSVLVYGEDLVLQGALGSGEGEFSRPIGIAFNASGDVYVADRTRDQVQVYGADRQSKGRFGQPGTLPGQIRHPLAIAVDKGANEIVLLDSPMVQGTYGLYEGSRAQVFDSTGEYLRGLGQNGIGEGKLAKARGVAADQNGRIYVSDAFQNVVSVFDRTGEYLETVFDAAIRLRNPTGVAIDEISGRLFVSSGSADRIDIFGKPGGTAESRIVHTVQVEALGPGVVTPAGAVAVQDHQDLLLSCTPDPDHVVADILIDGISIGARDSYALADVTAGHRVQVLFADPTSFITATADAGPDQIVREGEPVMLSGRDSFATNGIAAYLWTQVAGTPSGQLNNLTTDSVSFTAPRVDEDGTVLGYQLKIIDEAGLPAVDQVLVHVYKALGKGAYPQSRRVTGRMFTVNVELPAGISYRSLDLNSIAVTRIDGQAIQPVTRTGSIKIRDSNRNRIPDLAVKFDRKRFKGLLVSGPATITVSGRLLDGSEFQQSFRLVFSR